MWWYKYRNKPEILKGIVTDLLTGEQKFSEEFWEKQWQILQKYGRSSISGLSSAWRKRFWDLDTERKALSKPLLQDAVAILDYLGGENE